MVFLLVKDKDSVDFDSVQEVFYLFLNIFLLTLKTSIYTLVLKGFYMKKNERTTIQIAKDLFKKLKEQAIKNKRSASKEAEEIIEKGLKK